MNGCEGRELYVYSSVLNQEYVGVSVVHDTAFFGLGCPSRNALHHNSGHCEAGVRL